MGTDITLYRVRIGFFRGGRAYRIRQRPAHLASKQSCRSDDIHFRMFATLFVIFMILACCHHTQAILQYLSTFSVLIKSYDTDRISKPTSYGTHWLMISHLGTDSTEVYTSIYMSYSQRLLELASDIELNPGPTTDTCKILEAIEESKTTMTKRIEQVMCEVTAVKTDLSSMKNDVSDIRSKVKNIEQDQVHFDSKFTCLDDKVDKLAHSTEMFDEDLASLAYNYEKQCDEINNLKIHLNNVERELIQNDIRIFGLNESPDENEESLKLKVLDEVLRVAYPNENYDSNPIISARRIGAINPKHFRMVIVKLSKLKHKLSVFSVREVLRQSNIKVASVLSSLERKQLKELKESGRNGYFKNGVLKVLDKRHIQKAVRKIPVASLNDNDMSHQSYDDVAAANDVVSKPASYSEVVSNGNGNASVTA